MILAALAVFGGLLLTEIVAGPVKALTEAAVRLGQGDFSTSIPPGGAAEVGMLARTMEDMRRNLVDLTGTLRRREAEAQAVLGGVVEGVYAVDKNRIIRYLNPQAARLLNVTTEQAVGQFCGDILKPRLEDGRRPCDFRCPILQARIERSAKAIEHLQVSNAEARTTVITSAGMVDGLQVQVIRDETELEAVRRARDSVLANISHEFRTPLAAQLASIELLMEGLTTLQPEQQHELVQSLERGTLRLTRLIDNLLESVRIESGQLNIRHQSVELLEVVEDAQALVNSLLTMRRQTLEVTLPDDLPLIAGDKPRLTQVFVNLLANANKFAPEGSVVRIGARSRPILTYNVGWRTKARVPPRRETDTIFARFQRGSEEEPEPGGLGLGLWIVKSIIDRHAGTIALVRTAAGPDSLHPFLATGVVGMKMLVADDDRDLRELIGFTLTQAGYLVVKAADGPAALRMFEAETPDLVVLDINMPGASGFQVCEAIRKRSRVPVIMLTVRGEEEDLVRALELGADDYLTKPFSPRTLLARIKALLRRAGMENAAPLAAGRVALDIDEHTVQIGSGEPVRLTKLELRLLQMLLANAGHTVSTDRLLVQVWGHRNSADRQLLKQLVHRLRQKIEVDPATPQLLQTASGAGYKLVVD